MECKSKIIRFQNYLLETKGSYLLASFCAALGIRIWGEVDSTSHEILALLFTCMMLLATFFRKNLILFYPFIITSILFFTYIGHFANLDYYVLLALSNHFLIICAFLFPNPFTTLLIGCINVGLLLNYHDQVSPYYIRGSIIDFVITIIFYSFLAYLIRYLYKKKTELQLSEKNNQLLLSLLPDPLIIHQGGKIVFINQEGLKLIRARKKDKIIGRRILDFVPVEYHKTIFSRINEIYLLKEMRTPNEIKIRTLTGEVIDVETTGNAINYHGIPSILSMVRDITVQKSQTAELIQKSDKLSLVGQLAAGIAHEIRNPLTSLRGFIQLLQYKSDENKDYCEIMLSELDRINLIVGEFLILAKPHMIQFTNRDINQIIRHVLTLIGTQAVMKNIHLIDKLADGLPVISCEENQLKQVIINMIKNGIEAMPTGGTITVETGMFSSDQIYIRITDEGNGIPKEILNRLGEPFYTTKEAGTGLGLMVCYKIIDNHQGILRVESEVGRGTTFEIILNTPLSTKIHIERKTANII
ncbi:ATP-binding protein [Pseudoneobacillus sp. C159]